MLGQRFGLTEEQAMIAETAERFAADALRPQAAAWDREGRLDRGVIEALGELGFGGIYVSEDHGGAGLGRLDAALIFEQLAKGCVSHATFLSIHNMVAAMASRYGSAELAARYATRLAACELIGSYCLTEPGSGSDAASLTTRARREDDCYVLNGAKVFISGAGFSDLYLVMARTSEDGARGISAFLVEKGTPGLSFGKLEAKMGWRAQPTAMVSFDDCRIPAANLLGEEGAGFKYAMAGLDGGRINIAACSLGAAEEALARAVVYAKDRKQFGRPIAELQSLQFKIADMATELEAARTMLYEAARRLDAGAPGAGAYAAMTKRFVTDAGFEVANQALQIHGGYGYLSEYEIERIVRDLRVHQILEGTNEIMRVIAARAVLAAG